MDLDNESTAERRIEIITGRYGKGTASDNETVDRIFGRDFAEDRFELYFHLNV